MVAATKWKVNDLGACYKLPKLLPNTFYSFRFPIGKLKDFCLHFFPRLLQQAKAETFLFTNNWQLGD